jgi:hypothetical protein
MLASTVSSMPCDVCMGGGVARLPFVGGGSPASEPPKSESERERERGRGCHQ